MIRPIREPCMFFHRDSFCLLHPWCKLEGAQGGGTRGEQKGMSDIKPPLTSDEPLRQYGGPPRPECSVLGNEVSQTPHLTLPQKKGARDCVGACLQRDRGGGRGGGGGRESESESEKGEGSSRDF